jgi:pilus assembly protein CpaF
MDNTNLQDIYKELSLKPFSLEKYYFELTGEKKEEVINITKDELSRFYNLCNAIYYYFQEEWEREGVNIETLERQKAAILGKQLEVKFFKEKIEEYLKFNNKMAEWYPSWYMDIVDAIYQECWGLCGIAEWKYSAKYKNSQSAKIIGNKIFFMNNGKMILQEQTITDERRGQLIRALLLNRKNVIYKDDKAELHMEDDTRITIFGNRITKKNMEVIIFRKYIIPNYTFEEQAERHTIPKDSITFFKNFAKVGYNVCFTGAVRSSKTTALQIWQNYEDPTLEGIMVEESPEISIEKMMPNSPFVQLVVTENELESVIKKVMRSDADYIICAEARDGKSLNLVIRAANKGTRRCKTTYHTTDPIDFCYDVADEITKVYGGNQYNTIIKVAKSFHYILHFVQLNDKSQKRLKGIYEIRFNQLEQEISIHQICKYNYSSDDWSFKYDVGKDKEIIGSEENIDAINGFKEELKILAQRYPMEGDNVYKPNYRY